MPLKRLFVFTFIFTAAALGQNLNHPMSASRGDVRRTPRDVAFPDTVRVLAVMVQFQQDNDQAKDGNGHFVLAAQAGTPFIDAPPRDSAYFAGHLAFLSNYFGRSSKGKTIVRWTLVGPVFTLQGVMADYSPRSGESNLRLANLARDTWRKVDSAGYVADFSKFDCFVLFHAGVGRDVDLVSSLGFDPAPHDIPSIYLGPGALGTLLGGGIPVNGGAHQVTNTIIMPETENRTIQSATGSFLLNLGMNGLLCASLGSYLGLPDLFDTQSGATGIGRFGLMDGQSIFSFSGAFPPEPSAWEKYWLGWVTPIVTPAGSTTLSVPAVALADTIYRIPISDAEYFLLENRNRDPHRTGVTITSVSGVVTRQQHFARDTAGFAFDDITGLSGTITDVDVPDWSVPGGVDPDGTFFDGGILIWHVDESVINAKIAANAVNADSSYRGVNLEEADGSQDLGHTYDITQPGLGSENGTALDFWFKGNASPVNKNEFSGSTFPNSNSNLGALSHVTVNNFSVRGPRMTVQIVRGDAIAPVQGFPRQTGEYIQSNAMSVGNFGGNSGQGIVVGTSGTPLPRYVAGAWTYPPPVGAKVYLLPADSTSHVTPFRKSGVVTVATAQSGGFFTSPALADINGDGIPDLITIDGIGSLRAQTFALPTVDSLASPLFSRDVSGGSLTSPVVSDSLIALGNLHGVYFVRFDGTIGDSIPVSTAGGTYVMGIGRWRGANAFIVTYSDGTVRITRRTGAGTSAGADVVRTFGSSPIAGLATALFGPDSVRGRVLTALLNTQGELYLVDSSLSPVTGFPVSTGGYAGPVLADIDGDGMKDIVLCGTPGIIAYNAGGTLLDNFPSSVPEWELLGSPVVGDVDGDGKVEIVVPALSGLVYAVKGSGAPVPGFPLLAGQVINLRRNITTGGGVSGALLTSGGRIILTIASGDGSISAWVTGHYSGSPDPKLYPWPQYGKDSRHSALDLSPLTGVPLATSFFPPDRAYNWPNPVYSRETFFRYYVAQNSSVNIKIFDMAGDLVATLTGQGTGGIDNEIAWDVSHIQSGIYFARIQATSGGSSGVKIVKVAVVK